MPTPLHEWSFEGQRRSDGRNSIVGRDCKSRQYAKDVEKISRRQPRADGGKRIG